MCFLQEKEWEWSPFGGGLMFIVKKMIEGGNKKWKAESLLSSLYLSIKNTKPFSKSESVLVNPSILQFYNYRLLIC